MVYWRGANNHSAKSLLFIPILLLSFLISLTNAPAAQPLSDPARLLVKADSLSKAAQYEKALGFYKKAQDYYSRRGNHEKVLDSLFGLCSTNLAMNRFQQADKYAGKGVVLADSLFPKRPDRLAFSRLSRGRTLAARAKYDEAMKWYREGMAKLQASESKEPVAVRLLLAMGNLRHEQGQLEQSLTYLSRAEDLYHRWQINDKLLLGELYNRYGIVYQDQAKDEKALRYFRRALTLHRNQLHSDHPDIARIYNNIGIIHYYTGDYSRTLDHFRKATEILSRYHGRTHKLVAAGYNNIGIVYSEMGELEKATGYLEKALAIKEELLGAVHPDVAIGYMNIGAVYFDMKQYRKAIDYYKKSEDLHLELFPEGHPELANVYANLGEAYTRLENYRKALQYFEKDLSINKDRLGPEHPLIGDSYTKMGELYGRIEHYERSLNNFSKALSIFVRNAPRESEMRVETLEDVTYPNHLLEALTLRANTLKKYYESSENTRHLQRSLQDYLQAVGLIDKMQKSFSRQGSKMLLRERTRPLYEKALDTAYRLWKMDNARRYKEYALYLSEKSRNQILLQHLQKINARKFAGIPDSVIARESQITSRITGLQQRLEGLIRSADSTSRYRLRDSLFASRRALQQHIRRIENKYPSYYQLKYQPVSISASDIQRKQLAGGESYVEYFWGEEHLYAFVLNPGSFHLKRWRRDTLLSQQLVEYRKSLSGNFSTANIAELGHLLYKKLFRPVEPYLSGDRLFIIPDGPLHYIPFESLITEPPSDGPVNFGKLPYVLDKYSISYSPSASYLSLATGPETKDSQQRPFLGFAPSVDPDTSIRSLPGIPDTSNTFSVLPSSQREVREIGSLITGPGLWSVFAGKKDESALFLQNKATESRFKALPLHKYRYLHLATHAFVSDKHPRASGILFARPESETEDGVLYTSEIYNLRLDSELVTLSACKTGFGKLVEGEGMMSLSRAFQYAGAQNLLVSLWNVNDRSTAQLMIDFYKHHQTNTPRASSLQKAKQAMIEKMKFAHPKYWAPFILIGR